MRGGTLQINWHDQQPVLSLDFHPASRRLATAGADHDVKIWEVASDGSDGKLPTATFKDGLVANNTAHSSAVNVLRFSPSGEYLASGADGGGIILWKLHPADDGEAWKIHKGYYSMTRMFLTSSGLMTAHSLFLRQLTTLALFGKLVKALCTKS